MLFTMMLAVMEDDERSCAEEIYTRYQKYIYQIAVSILRNHHDAEDAVDTVMLNVINNIDKFVHSDRNKIDSQIVIYSRNAAINIYNKNKRKAETETPSAYQDSDGEWNDIEIHDEAADTDELILSRETVELVRKYLRMLPVEYRDPITLIYNMGYSYKETAAILGITVNAVGLRLRKAKQKLKEMAGGELYGRI